MAQCVLSAKYHSGMVRTQFMKKLFCTFLFLSACSGSSGAPHFLQGGEPPAPAGNLAPAVNGALAAQAGLEKLIFHVGPIDIPAHTSVESFLERPLKLDFALTHPAWVVGFAPKVVDATGQELPAALLHHAELINHHEANPLCPSRDGNPFAIASSLLTTVELPQGYGYPLLPSDPVEAKVVFQNPGEQTYINVFFEITLLTKPMNEFVALKDVQAVLLDFEPCSEQALQIEPGEFAEKTVTHILEKGGDLVLAHGVLQDYGVALQLKKDDALVPFWRSEAKLDSEHHIVDLNDNPFTDAKGVPLADGESVTLGATYNNASDNWLHSAEGAAMLYISPEE